VLEATKFRVTADHFLLNFDAKGKPVVVKEVLV
jgi:hypothetical protein